jgi:hypothetical protein
MGVLQRCKALLVDLEWSGHKWGDTECCPTCGAFVEGLPRTDRYEAETPLTHRADCELLAVLKELDNINE